MSKSNALKGVFTRRIFHIQSISLDSPSRCTIQPLNLQSRSSASSVNPPLQPLLLRTCLETSRFQCLRGTSTPARQAEVTLLMWARCESISRLSKVVSSLVSQSHHTYNPMAAQHIQHIFPPLLFFFPSPLFLLPFSPQPLPSSQGGAPPSRIPPQLLIPRPSKIPHLLAPPIDAILIPAAPSRHFDECGGDEEAEAGESADDAVAVAGDALFVHEGIDAVVGVLCWEGAAETHVDVASRWVVAT